MMATRSVYRGFSTYANINTRGKTFAVRDIDVVKQDLMNHIYTIPGERVMLPNFGTRIPLLAFEPLDEGTIQIVREDLQKVFDYDPRVEVREMSVLAIPNQNMILALVDLYYVEFEVTETLNLEFSVGS
jgi:phage baseplate assembly protein W